MIQNLFSKLPLFNESEGEDLSPEELAAQEKSERVEFHRTRVRNGPASFSSITNGQLRRQKARDLKAKSRKIQKRRVRAYHKQEAETAILRGHLKIVGVLASMGHDQRSEEQVQRSFAWIQRAFPAETVKESLVAATNAYLGRPGVVKEDQ